eukprot:CAMPEP_0170509684 /NCGR_PEP_ID=MMETSP0208-20121228/65349_1 /TAXON_ID=197538 /ORGANISM="Strombidium inclinatum, Strain S3" /LENGTH=217 /DNA_ID=CAMNT_0010793067 /DNA_START=1482 /DNA_END=2134 /DNA_ORIENTATION=-
MKSWRLGWLVEDPLVLKKLDASLQSSGLRTRRLGDTFALSGERLADLREEVVVRVRHLCLRGINVAELELKRNVTNFARNSEAAIAVAGQHLLFAIGTLLEGLQLVDARQDLCLGLRLGLDVLGVAHLRQVISRLVLAHAALILELRKESVHIRHDRIRHRESVLHHALTKREVVVEEAGGALLFTSHAVAGLVACAYVFFAGSQAALAFLPCLLLL